MSIFEAMMIICFGIAWPFSIYKSFQSRRTAGKSLLFLLIILIGYLSGIIHKFLYKPDPVLYLYFLNTVMVFIDILLFIRNKKIESNLEKKPE